MKVSGDLVKIVRVNEHEFHNSTNYHFCRRQKNAKGKKKKKIECNSLGIANSFDTVFGEKKGGVRGEGLNEVLITTLKKERKKKLRWIPN